MTTAVTPSTADNVGLFPVAYKIGSGKPGEATLIVHLLVNAPAKTITGYSQLTQAINPPLDMASKLEGSYTYMTVMADKTSILVVAMGYPVIDWPHHIGHGPVLLPNLKLRMILEKDWQSSTANYSYFENGTWHEVDNAPVSIIPQSILAN